MKIKKAFLKKIIKEEYSKIIKESALENEIMAAMETRAVHSHGLDLDDFADMFGDEGFDIIDRLGASLDSPDAGMPGSIFLDDEEGKLYIVGTPGFNRAISARSQRDQLRGSIDQSLGRGPKFKGHPDYE